MSRRLLVVALTAGFVSLAGAGCSFLPTSGDQGEAVSMDIRADPVPERKQQGSVEEALAGRFENEVLKSAGKAAPTTSQCIKKQGDTYDCTVDYAGHKVNFTATVTKPPTGASFSLFQYRVDSREVLLTKHSAHLAIVDVAKNYHPGTIMEDPRCDADIPEVAVYPNNKRTGHSCSAKKPGRATERFHVVASTERVLRPAGAF